MTPAELAAAAAARAAGGAAAGGGGGDAGAAPDAPEADAGGDDAGGIDVNAVGGGSGVGAGGASGRREVGGVPQETSAERLARETRTRERLAREKAAWADPNNTDPIGISWEHLRPLKPAPSAPPPRPPEPPPPPKPEPKPEPKPHPNPAPDREPGEDMGDFLRRLSAWEQSERDRLVAARTPEQHAEAIARQERHVEEERRADEANAVRQEAGRQNRNYVQQWNESDEDFRDRRERFESERRARLDRQERELDERLSNRTDEAQREQIRAASEEGLAREQQEYRTHLQGLRDRDRLKMDEPGYQDYMRGRTRLSRPLEDLGDRVRGLGDKVRGLGDRVKNSDFVRNVKSEWENQKARAGIRMRTLPVKAREDWQSFKTGAGRFGRNLANYLGDLKDNALHYAFRRHDPDVLQPRKPLSDVSDYDKVARTSVRGGREKSDWQNFRERTADRSSGAPNPFSAEGRWKHRNTGYARQQGGDDTVSPAPTTEPTQWNRERRETDSLRERRYDGARRRYGGSKQHGGIGRSVYDFLNQNVEDFSPRLRRLIQPVVDRFADGGKTSWWEQKYGTSDKRLTDLNARDFQREKEAVGTLNPNKPSTRYRQRRYDEAGVRRMDADDAQPGRRTRGEGEERDDERTNTGRIVREAAAGVARDGGNSGRAPRGAATGGGWFTGLGGGGRRARPAARQPVARAENPAVQEARDAIGRVRLPRPLTQEQQADRDFEAWNAERERNATPEQRERWAEADRISRQPATNLGRRQ